MFHDYSRAGTLTSSAKSAQAQRTREQVGEREHVASQSHPVLRAGRKQQAVGDSSLRALPTHFLWTISFSWSLVWFLLPTPTPPVRSFFSRPLSFPSAGVSHPMPTPFSLCFGLLSPPPPGIPCGRVCLLRMGWKGSAITLGTCGGLQKVQEPSHPQASAPPSHSGLRPLPMCEGEEDTSLRI